MHGITVLRWMFWLEVDGGFEDPSSIAGTWCGWQGGCGQRQRQVQLLGAAALSCLLVDTELGTGQSSSSTHLEEIEHQFPVHCTGGVSRRN